MIQAKIIADSIHKQDRLTTVQVRAPKFLDAEVEKHRMISSNSSSDRAIPLAKLLSSPPYIPKDVRLDQPGMQGDDVISDDDLAQFHDDLINLFGYTADILERWNFVHKQHINRYLLGFSWQEKVMTATEWTNFFLLRLSRDHWDDALNLAAESWVDSLKAAGYENASISTLGGEYAQPEIQLLAGEIKRVMDLSTPEALEPGQWHLPYVDKYDDEGNPSYYEDATQVRLISASHCARASNLNHDQSQPDIQKDLGLANRLLIMGHWTPFEHQATPMKTLSHIYSDHGQTHASRNGKMWSNNFRGWIQQRAILY